MKKPLLLILLVLPTTLLATDINSVSTDQNTVKTVNSPPNRVAMLELYTSEGCSSCPPADRFLSELKASGISDRQLIPMAFHVTYWDYIGWKDRFAKKQFDQRQKDLANKKNTTTVYTPQFVLSGEDYRRYANFSEDVSALVKQKASVDLMLSIHVETNSIAGELLKLTVRSDTSKSKVKDIGFYFVVLENNLMSDVSDGENEGEQLQHDFVVRQMVGPYIYSKNTDQSDPGRFEYRQNIGLRPEWKKQDLSIVVFAENSKTGEVLQAVRLDY